jgi:hypothetical protein
MWHLITLIAFFFISCGWNDSTVVQKNKRSINAENEKNQESMGFDRKLIVFIFMVNQTGEDVLVEVKVDGKKLFTERISAQLPEISGEVPPPATHEYPAKEIKVGIDENAKSLEVWEIYSERRLIYPIQNFVYQAGGFRITIGEKGIFIKQDYFPIR